MPDYAQQAKLRVDKWLWFARVTKTRSLAATITKNGQVRVNGERMTKPHGTVTLDDVLTITLERQIKVLRIVDIGTRRGPAPEAQALYEDLSPPPVKRDPAVRPMRQAVREEGAGRPTKKQRRELDRLRGDGEL